MSVLLVVGWTADGAHSQAPDPAIEVLKVLKYTQSPQTAFDALNQRVGRNEGLAPEDVITKEQVDAFRLAVSRLPLEILDVKSAKRVLKAGLEANIQSTLSHWTDVLERAIKLSTEVRPAAMSLYVTGQDLNIGNRKENLRSLELDRNNDPPRDWLDIVYIRPDGAAVDEQVVGSPLDLQDEAVMRRVARPFTAWNQGGSPRDFNVSFMRAGGEEILDRPLDRIQRPVESVIEALPAHLLSDKDKKHFTNPGKKTVALVVVRLPDGSIVLPPDNKPIYNIGGGAHAEQNSQDASVRAVAFAAENGSPGEPAEVLFLLNRSPCPPCGTFVIRGLDTTRMGLDPGKRANVKLTIAATHAYDGKEGAVGPALSAPTLTSFIAEAEKHMIEVKVLVAGRLTARGQWYLDTVLRAGSAPANGPPTARQLLGPHIVWPEPPDGYAREAIFAPPGFPPPGSNPLEAPLTREQGQPQAACPATACAPGAGDAPGGVDFSTLELRYLADAGPGQGVRYAFNASPAPSHQHADAGRTAARQTSDSFFVWLALSPDRFWVNLNPNEPDRIIDPALGATDAGRILLQADLLMKKTVAGLIHPDSELGKQFWNSLEAGSDNEVCLSFRQWIVPGTATVHEDGDSFYIIDAPLTVQLEAEYLQAQGVAVTSSCRSANAAEQKVNEAAFRSLILPKVQEAVNSSPDYAELRRVYLSRVAAEWYRQRSAQHPTRYGDLINREEVSAWPARQPWSPRAVFDQYVNSYKNGEFRITHQREEGDYLITDTYVYGGADFSSVPFNRLDPPALQEREPNLFPVVAGSTTRAAFDRHGRAWLGGVAGARSPDAGATAQSPSSDSQPLGRGSLRLIAMGVGLVLLLILLGRRAMRRSGDKALSGERVRWLDPSEAATGTVKFKPESDGSWWGLKLNEPLRDGALLRVAMKPPVGTATAVRGPSQLIRIRVRRVPRRAKRQAVAAVLLASSVLLVLLAVKEDPPIAVPPVAKPIAKPLFAPTPVVSPHRISRTERPQREFATGTCLTGEIPKGVGPSKADDVKEVACDSVNAHYKVIQVFPGTSDMDLCRRNVKTQYSYSRTLTRNGVPILQFVYCLVGIGRFAR